MLDFSFHPMLELFRGLDEQATAALELREYRPGERLMEESGLRDMALFLVLRGICVADKEVLDDEYRFATYKILPGRFIGLRELLSPTPMRRVISITAKTPVTALHIEGKEYLRWQSAYPELYNAVIANVLSSQFGVSNLIVNCLRRDTLAAGAYYLCFLYKSYLSACHEPEYPGAVRIWDTRREIGTALARDVRSVDRMIKEFTALGMIATRGGKIHIDKRQAGLLEDYYTQKE